MVRALALAVLLAACLPPAVSHSCEGPARDHVGLVDRLRCARIRVDVGGEVRLAPFRVPGVVLQVSNVESARPLAASAELTSFHYDDTDLGMNASMVAEMDAGAYRGAARLYRRERVIVLYAGGDAALVGLLTQLLGPQLTGP